jgi:hypothetical protein
MVKYSFYTIAAILLSAIISDADDWGSCEHALSSISRAARDASDTAQELHSEASELEEKRSELQDCISYPQTYDLRRDRCRSHRTEYEDVKQNYEHKRRELQLQLSILESGFRSVRLSCGYNVPSSTTGNPLRPAEKQAGSCDFMQSYKNKVPAGYLLAICRKSMAEDECQKCLQ